jgi:hypothetical protein
MTTAVVLAILLAFAVLRRVIEPACPACSAKAWGDGPGPLSCARCGWSSGPASEVEASQYEIPLTGDGRLGAALRAPSGSA